MATLYDFKTEKLIRSALKWGRSALERAPRRTERQTLENLNLAFRSWYVEQALERAAESEAKALVKRCNQILREFQTPIPDMAITLVRRAILPLTASSQVDSTAPERRPYR